MPVPSHGYRIELCGFLYFTHIERTASRASSDRYPVHGKGVVGDIKMGDPLLGQGQDLPGKPEGRMAPDFGASPEFRGTAKGTFTRAPPGHGQMLVDKVFGRVDQRIQILNGLGRDRLHQFSLFPKGDPLNVPE